MLFEELQIKHHEQLASLISRVRANFQDQINWISDRIAGIRSFNESRRSFGGSSSNGGLPRSVSSNRKGTIQATRLKSPNRSSSTIVKSKPFPQSKSSHNLGVRYEHSNHSLRKYEERKSDVMSKKSSVSASRRSNSMTYFGQTQQ